MKNVVLSIFAAFALTMLAAVAPSFAQSNKMNEEVLPGGQQEASKVVTPESKPDMQADAADCQPCREAKLHQNNPECTVGVDCVAPAGTKKSGSGSSPSNTNR